jgi:hypothetical protein
MCSFVVRSIANLRNWMAIFEKIKIKLTLFYKLRGRQPFPKVGIWWKFANKRNTGLEARETQNWWGGGNNPFLFIKVKEIQGIRCHQLTSPFTQKKKTIMTMVLLHFFFLVCFQFLWCSQTGNHLKKDLVKFGYRPNVKVKSFKNPFIFWLPCWNLL